jgi:hypothetical protein
MTLVIYSCATEGMQDFATAALGALYRTYAPVVYPSVKGSRVLPVSSTHTDLTWVYSLRDSSPFSLPIPLCL